MNVLTPTLLLLTAVTSADPPAAGYEPIAAVLSEFLEPEIQQKQIPALSIALVDGDRIVWAAGFGAANSNGGLADADTIYRVGSISKLLTDTAVMQQVATGALDLDEEVSKSLPSFAPKNTSGVPITLRMLMSHRAGLVRESPVGNYFDPTDPGIEATNLSLNTTSLTYVPGTRTKYSNAGISVIGEVFARQAGASFEDAIQTSLLRPLGMTSSTYLRTAADPARLAEGIMHSHDGQRFPAPTWDLGTLPAGNLYSTVNDLGRFLMAVFNKGTVNGKSVIEPKMLETMLSPLPVGPDGQPEFGVGFHLSTFEGRKAFGHGGAVYGFSTQIKGLPEEKLGVVAVASLDGSNGFVTRVVDHALRMMLAKKRGEPIPPLVRTTDVPAEIGRTLEGAYQNEKEFADVDYREGKLFLREGSRLSEVRQLGDEFVIDDPFSFGTPVEFQSPDELVLRDKTFRRVSESLPEPPPAHWEGLIGEYGWDHNTLYIFEDRGQLWCLIEWFYYYPLTELSPDEFAFPDYGLYLGEKLLFERNEDGDATKVIAAEVPFERRQRLRAGETFRIAPQQFLDDLRTAAMKAEPPAENGEFRTPELVELATLDPTIHLEIRYASTNNFLGTPFYKEARAFLQRPAAEALLRVHQRLNEQGLGVLIYDGYRPWFVTKMFWEATPADLRRFVADPVKGSRHNRGCAVDLTLYHLDTGEPVETVANYDEFSTRSYPNYPGGTSRQRWYRKLLRDLMESEGFDVYEYEWWHFDHRDWRNYPLLNKSFESM